MATITTAASVYDQKAILPLLDELKGRYPDLPFAYILLDRGYAGRLIPEDKSVIDFPGRFIDNRS
jgi:hypothetical protein